MTGPGNLARRRRLFAARPTRLFGAPRPRRRDRSGVDEPETWRAGLLIWTATSLTVVAALFFILWLAWSIYVFVHGEPTAFRYDPDRRCLPLGFSCGVISNFATSVLLIALASFFLLGRFFGLQRGYRARARTESRELVQTAGAILDEVVGRDELCKVVMADLHDRQSRPHVLIGGVGTGKTAVLVRLMEFLADKRAVPVPVRLRDATTELDFENLARERFLHEVNQRLLNSATGETIWRRLRQDRKIVVLADGLEEALIGTSAEPERDNIIRAAIRRAHQQRLPLVIASRPHDPLRATEAAILALEPLSYEAALAYIGGDGTGEDERRLAWIVETAEVVEAPLYLQITHDLHAKGLLDPASAGQLGVVDTRGLDRSKLRLGLLETWERALVSGHLREEVPLSQAARRAAVEHVSALACVGLSRDRLEVEFDDLPAKTISAEIQNRLAKIDEETRHTPRSREARRAAGRGLGRRAGPCRAARQQCPVPAQPRAGLSRVAAAGCCLAGPRVPQGGPAASSARPRVPHRAGAAVAGGTQQYVASGLRGRRGQHQPAAWPRAGHSCYPGCPARVCPAVAKGCRRTRGQQGAGHVRSGA